MRATALRIIRGANEIGIRAAETLAASFELILPLTLPPGDRLLGLGNDGAFKYFNIGSSSYERTFQNTDLVAGKIVVVHGLGKKIVCWSIADNSDRAILPDEITFLDINSLEIELTQYGPITGAWTVRVCA